MKICAIIPALNEERTVADVVHKTSRRLELMGATGTVIVVDDGSSDRTADLARDAGAHVVSHATNCGVGKAFHTGLTEALRLDADIILNIDADGQFDPDNIPALLQPIIDRRADVTTASRFKDPELVPVMPPVKLWGNRMMSRLVSKIAGKKLYDVSCGFRSYNREAALRLNLWGSFTYTQESILDLVIKGMRLEEVPMAIQGVRSVGKSRVASNLWNYGYRALKIILQTYRDFWPMRFFGWLSLAGLLPGVGLIGFLFYHRLTSGGFSPHIWAGFVGGGLLTLGIMTVITGLMAQMLTRLRLNQEEILYLERSRRAQSPEA